MPQPSTKRHDSDSDSDGEGGLKANLPHIPTEQLLEWLFEDLSTALSSSALDETQLVCFVWDGPQEFVVLDIRKLLSLQAQPRYQLQHVTLGLPCCLATFGASTPGAAKRMQKGPFFEVSSLPGALHQRVVSTRLYQQKQPDVVLHTDVVEELLEDICQVSATACRTELAVVH